MRYSGRVKIELKLMNLVVVALIAACDRPDPPAQAQRADSANVPAAAAPPPIVVTEELKKDVRDVAAFTLSMERMEKYFTAQKNMAVAEMQMSAEERAVIERDAQASGNNTTLNDMVSSIERHPKIHDAVKRAGLTAREYALITATYMQASMAQSVLQSRPNENQDSLLKMMRVHPANMAFVRQNGAEIQRRGQALEAELRQATRGQ